MAGLKCEDVENVTVSVEHMSANKLNFWLSKFSSFEKLNFNGIYKPTHVT